MDRQDFVGRRATGDRGVGEVSPGLVSVSRGTSLSDRARDGNGSRSVVPRGPLAVRISGVTSSPRTIHQDPRGYLLETFRSDEATDPESVFKMTYTSLTAPGQFRDPDRWHVHRVQTDRFLVVLGEMTLALLDDRPSSTSKGTLDVIRLRAVPLSEQTHPRPREMTSFLVTIPPGVLHALGNLSSGPFVYQNFPTELYNSSDEVRVPFSERVVSSLNRTFAWSLVESGEEGNAMPVRP